MMWKYLIFALLAAALAFGQNQSAIVDVTVLDMHSAELKPHRTVMIRDGRIEVVRGAVAGEKFFRKTSIIDGRGKYLLPGLIDSHVHLFSGDDLLPYVAHGVTTVVNMSGSTADLQLKLDVLGNAIIGPRIYTAGTTIDGVPPLNETFATAETPEEARAIVRSQLAMGYDFIKVYGTLTPAAFDAIAAECKAHKVLLAGHINRQVPPNVVFESGQRLAAHAEDLLFARFNNIPADSELDEFARTVAKSRVFVTANVSLNAATIAQIKDLEGLLKNGDGAELSAAAYSQWIRSNNRNLEGNPADRIAETEQIQALVLRFVGLLHRYYAPIVLGTDAAAYQVPGVSVWQELRETAHAGLSNFEALQTATLNPGTLIGQEIDPRLKVGAIEPGAVADLLLLNKSPLESLDNLSLIEGVMLRGRWLSRDQLDSLGKARKERLRVEYKFVEEVDALLEKGDTTQAVERIDGYSRGYPLFSEWVLAQKVHRNAKDPQVALRLSDIERKMYPKSFSAELLASQVEAAAGDRRKALEHAQKSLALQPGNADTTNQIEKLRFSALPTTIAEGSYPFALLVDGHAVDAKLTLQKKAGSWHGSLQAGGDTLEIRDVIAGGDEMWFRAGNDMNEKELRVHFQDGVVVSGYWCAMFGKNGKVERTGKQ